MSLASITHLLGQFNISEETKGAFTNARDYVCENKVFVISTVVSACLNPTGFVVTTAATALGFSAYYMSPWAKHVTGQENGWFQHRIQSFVQMDNKLVEKQGTYIPLISVSGNLQMLSGAFECCLLAIRQAAAFLQKVPVEPFSVSISGMILGAQLARKFALTFFEDCSEENLDKLLIKSRLWIECRTSTINERRETRDEIIIEG